MHDNGWSKDLRVAVSGHGVVSHVGSAVLRLVADNLGLAAGLSRTLARRGFTPVHDRGRVLTDLAVCIADGGRSLSDIATLVDPGELFGPVASDTTVWHTLDEIDAKTRTRIAETRARVRRRVWKKITARHGRIPPSKVADTDLGKTVVIRLDSTIQVAHSDKQGAAPTWKGTYGHHSLGGWCDNTGESLFEQADGWRYQVFVTNTPGRQLDFLEARHRAHARVEDRVRTGKATGLDHLPSRLMDINHGWTLAASIATDLLAWTRLLCLDNDLATAEPATLRYRLLHTAARIVKGQRRRTIKIPETWPWAHQLAAAFTAAFALTPT